jgi:hypothetical protein
MTSHLSDHSGLFNDVSPNSTSIEPSTRCGVSSAMLDGPSHSDAAFAGSWWETRIHTQASNTEAITGRYSRTSRRG